MDGDQPFRLGGQLGRVFDENQRRLDALPQLQLYQPPPPPPPAPGSEAALIAHYDELRARDLRSPARVRVDEGWRSLQADAMARYGRSVPLEHWEIRDPGARAALERARDAEASFIIAASGPSKEAADAAFNAFTGALAVYLTRITRDWPSAAEKAARDAHHRRVW